MGQIASKKVTMVEILCRDWGPGGHLNIENALLPV